MSEVNVDGGSDEHIETVNVGQGSTSVSTIINNSSGGPVSSGGGFSDVSGGSSPDSSNFEISGENRMHQDNITVRDSSDKEQKEGNDGRNRSNDTSENDKL